MQIDIDNLTWNDVQTKLIDVQREQQMCIMHKVCSSIFITISKIIPWK